MQRFFLNSSIRSKNIAALTSRPEFQKNPGCLNVEADLDLTTQPYEISHGRIFSSNDLWTLQVFSSAARKSLYYNWYYPFHFFHFFLNSKTSWWAYTPQLLKLEDAALKWAKCHSQQTFQSVRTLKSYGRIILAFLYQHLLYCRAFSSCLPKHKTLNSKTIHNWMICI